MTGRRGSRRSAGARVGSALRAAGLAALIAALAATAAPRAAGAVQDTGGAVQDTPAPAQDSAAPPDTTPPVTLESIDARLDRLMGRVDSLSSLEGILLRLAGEDPAAGDDERGDLGDWVAPGVVALLLFLLFRLLVRVSSWLLDLFAERNVARRLLYKRLVPIVRVFIWAVFAVIVARGVFGFETDTLLAAGAAIGVVVGFAAQDILKNIFGGLVIIGDRPFQVGDKVRVGDSYGEVRSIGLWSTRIVTPDDNEVSVPNAQVVGGQVSNANSGNLDCQVVTDLYLPGWVDIRAAKEIAYRAAATSRYVFLGKPIAVIATDEVETQFFTHLKVKAYVQDIRHEFLFMSDVTERARAAFVEAGLLPAWHGALAVKDVDGGGPRGSAANPRGSAGSPRPPAGDPPAPPGDSRAGDDRQAEGAPAMRRP